MKSQRMKKIPLILVFTILFVSFNAMTIFATTTGTDANGFTWQSEDGVSYSITGYNGSDTNITIPSSIDGHTVTSIANNAFNGNNDIKYRTLTSVTIPNTVTSIGSFAFYYCSSLVNISIPDSVTSIGDSAFAYCITLPSITLPTNLSDIANSTFQDCKAFTALTIPSSVTRIGDRAFLECTSLTNIIIPSSVTSIGDSAFQTCKVLNNVVMPDSVISVGDYLFYDCWALTNVKLSSNITRISNFMFYRCWKLAGIELPSGITSIGNNAFEQCEVLTSIVIPNSVKTIGGRAFLMCKALPNIIIPSSVKTINYNAFAHCYAFTNIIIPDSVTSIGDYAFYYCTSLKEVTIPQSVTDIGFLTFDSCNPDFKIKGFGGSYAQIYAGSNSIAFQEVPTIKYTVTFNSEGGSIVGGIQADNNTLIAEPTAPTKTGYIFGGWYKDISFNTLWDFANDKVTDNVTLFAKWIEKVVTNITMSNRPTKTSYIQGQGLDLTGAKIVAAYNDGTIQTVNVTSGMVSGYNANQVGTQTITVSYNGKITTFTVSVIAKAITNITMSNRPTKTSYIQGQGLDLTGAKIVAAYNDGTTQAVNVTSGMVSGYNANQVGTQTITVSYNGKITTFTVNVIAKSVTNATMSNGPTKTSYIQRQGLDLTGARIVVAYNDGTTKTVNVTSGMVSGYNANQVGTQTIKVTYNGKITTFRVNVIATYTVTFNSNGGSVVANKVVTYNSLVSVPANPIRSGYTFLAWYKEPTLATKWNFTRDKITMNRRLYAKWAKNPVAPSTIAISKPSAKSAKISWRGVTGVSGYEVWRATSSAGAYTCIAKLAGTSYTDTTLTKGKTYYYKVRSYKIIDGVKVYSGYVNKTVTVKI